MNVCLSDTCTLKKPNGWISVVMLVRVRVVFVRTSEYSLESCFGKCGDLAMRLTDDRCSS